MRLADMDLPEATGLPLVAEPLLVDMVHRAAEPLRVDTVHRAAAHPRVASARLVAHLPAASVRPAAVLLPVVGSARRPVAAATVSPRRTRTAVRPPACRAVASVVRLR